MKHYYDYTVGAWLSPGDVMINKSPSRKTSSMEEKTPRQSISAQWCFSASQQWHIDTPQALHRFTAKS